MKRKNYAAIVTDESGTEVAAGIKYAMNSAIRETEALVRAVAREEGTYYHGGRPERVGPRYTRRWVSDAGRVLNVRAELVP